MAIFDHLFYKKNNISAMGMASCRKISHKHCKYMVSQDT